MNARKSNTLNSYVYYGNQVNRFFTPTTLPSNHLPIVESLQNKENTWYINTSGEAYNLNQGGRIGINTMTPKYPLDVNGEVNISSNLILSGDIKTPLGVSYNVPTGSVVAFLGQFQYGGFGNDPAGWMVCDGRQLPIDGIYKKLYEFIGYQFGYGDEYIAASGNTFRKYLLPDYRGAFLRGSGDNSQNVNYNIDGGKRYFGPALNKYQDSSTEAHTHNYTDVYHTVSGNQGLKFPSVATGANGAKTDPLNSVTDQNVANAFVDLVGNSTTTINESRPYNYGINWIIKL